MAVGSTEASVRTRYMLEILILGLGGSSSPCLQTGRGGGGREGVLVSWGEQGKSQQVGA
jgi:hypothetical protein